MPLAVSIDHVFAPSVGVDMVFNISSLEPCARSSIIYDGDVSQKTLTIAQPLTPFSRNTDFKELHVTTIFHDKNRKVRLGLRCTRFNLIDRYTLANHTKVMAVLLNYDLPVIETNIRSAFRLPLSTRFTIKGKIVSHNLEFYSTRDFFIRDISLTGLGIVIPKKQRKTRNPLMEIQLNEVVRMGIILWNMDLQKSMGTLLLKVQVSRINVRYSEQFMFIGLKILHPGKEAEDLLNRFIHDAQIQELKRLSKKNL